MLITFEEIDKVLSSKNIDITGIFHIGAHDCEELTLYNKLGLKNGATGGKLLGAGGAGFILFFVPKNNKKNCPRYYYM